MKRRWSRVSLALTFFTLVGLTVPALAAPAPDLGDCQQLQAPEGSTVIFHVYATGVQIYQWNGTSWNFVAPEAVLFGDAGHDAIVGIHFGTPTGPAWQSLSGSKVIGNGATARRCTPDPTAIPWLGLDALSTEGPGIFDQVTFLQRLNTVGGIAPTAPGSSVGEMVRVPYTADYVFYQGHANP
jgi:uncharacterized protein DUF3455